MRIRDVMIVAAVLLAVGLNGLALAEEPAVGRAGRAELRFMQGMIDHHQMALDMAQDCLTNATSQAVVTLCENIITAQSAEIGLLQGWLRDWYRVEYAPVSMMSGIEQASDAMAGMDHSGHGVTDNSMHTDPPMTMGMMAGLNRLDGADYEVAWLEAMIDHHDDALHMAERIVRRAEHADLRALAEMIIADQTAEIAHMEALLAEIDGNND